MKKIFSSLILSAFASHTLPAAEVPQSISAQTLAQALDIKNKDFSQGINLLSQLNKSTENITEDTWEILDQALSNSFEQILKASELTKKVALISLSRNIFSVIHKEYFAKFKKTYLKEGSKSPQFLENMLKTFQSLTEEIQDGNSKPPIKSTLLIEMVEFFEHNPECLNQEWIKALQEAWQKLPNTSLILPGIKKLSARLKPAHDLSDKAPFLELSLRNDMKKEENLQGGGESIENTDSDYFLDAQQRFGSWVGADPKQYIMGQVSNLSANEKTSLQGQIERFTGFFESFLRVVINVVIKNSQGANQAQENWGKFFKAFLTSGGANQEDGKPSSTCNPQAFLIEALGGPEPIDPVANLFTQDSHFAGFNNDISQLKEWAIGRSARTIYKNARKKNQTPTTQKLEAQIKDNLPTEVERLPQKADGLTEDATSEDEPKIKKYAEILEKALKQNMGFKTETDQALEKPRDKNFPLILSKAIIEDLDKGQFLFNGSMKEGPIDFFNARINEAKLNTTHEYTEGLKLLKEAIEKENLSKSSAKKKLEIQITISLGNKVCYSGPQEKLTINNLDKKCQDALEALVRYHKNATEKDDILDADIHRRKTHCLTVKIKDGDAETEYLNDKENNCKEGFNDRWTDLLNHLASH